MLNTFPPYYELAPMSALFRIVRDELPPFPEQASHQLCDFLNRCFQKNPNLRVSAEDLQKHVWFNESEVPKSRSTRDVKKHPRGPQKADNHPPSKHIILSAVSYQEDERDEDWNKDFQDINDDLGYKSLIVKKPLAPESLKKIQPDNESDDWAKDFPDIEEKLVSKAPRIPTIRQILPASRTSSGTDSWGASNTFANSSKVVGDDDTEDWSDSFTLASTGQLTLRNSSAVGGMVAHSEDDIFTSMLFDDDDDDEFDEAKDFQRNRDSKSSSEIAKLVAKLSPTTSVDSSDLLSVIKDLEKVLCENHGPQSSKASFGIIVPVIEILDSLPDNASENLVYTLLKLLNKVQSIPLNFF